MDEQEVSQPTDISGAIESVGEESREITEDMAKLVDPAMAQMLGIELPEEKKVQEETKKVEETTDAAVVDEKKEEKTTEKVSNKKQNVDDFKFDAEQYKKEGITDEKTLSILEKRDRQHFYDRKMIGDQGKKLGDIRKESENKIKELSSQLEKVKDVKTLTDEEYEDIALEKGDRAARREEEERSRELKNKEEMETKLVRERNKLTVLDKAPDIEDHLDEMYQILKDNAGEEAANNFKNDPFWLHPAISIEMARAVRSEKEMNRYKAENESLRKQLKAAPQSAMDRIRKIGKNGTISVEDGENGTGKDQYTDLSMNPALMSSAELKNYFK